MTSVGFTSAELAAAEWSRLWRERRREAEEQRRKRRGDIDHGDSKSWHSRRAREKRRRYYDDDDDYPRPDKRRSKVDNDDDEARETERVKRIKELQEEIKREEGSEETALDKEDDDVPPDPKNPLFAAYERPRYTERPRGRQRRHSRDEDFWTHDRFRERSLSPERPSQDTPLYDTRVGSWRARAGGVYLPPEPASDDETIKKEEEPKQSGARRYWE
eukprot:Blabericola_migrator_1__1272@NODE_132_length_13257_cov_135_196133_g116_i0_p6_GENE_NODE_132_length_13257_cov_135_196133_g116_i0NODE_132_length_13257_cov_135_196133_g116_i0_p6_ORF_typecomplete_len217_score36_76_NODE_132_length_13257_cov_135_196133_g116_i09171567